MFLYLVVMIPLLFCTTHADTEYLPLAEVEEATKEVCSDWYTLAVELEISHRVRMVGGLIDYLRVLD